MIYIFEGINNDCSIIYNPDGLSQVQTNKAIQIEEFPVNPYAKGTLKADKSQELVWWEEAPASKVLTKFQFLGRLTQEELVKISSPELFVSDVMTLAQVKAVLMVFNSANEINLLDNSLDGFKGVMVQSGLFTAERVDEITAI